MSNRGDRKTMRLKMTNRGDECEKNTGKNCLNRTSGNLETFQLASKHSKLDQDFLKVLEDATDQPAVSIEEGGNAGEEGCLQAAQARNLAA